MAPEIFIGKEYTKKCDIWSFGVLLTEIVTYGNDPYPGKQKLFEWLHIKYIIIIKNYSLRYCYSSEPLFLNLDLDKAACIQAVQRGYRMKRPADCPETLYDIMLLCWNHNPDERPTFMDLQERLLKLIPESSLDINWDILDTERKYWLKYMTYKFLSMYTFHL